MTLALAVAIVVYATIAGDRLPQVVAGVGAAGCALTALAFLLRRPSVFPVGLAAVGGAYGVFLSLRSGAVDARAPLVAAALFVAAELGYSSLGRINVRSERLVAARRVGGLVVGAVLTGLVGSLLLTLATGVSGGVGLEAAGVAAAALTLAAIAVLASRASV
ncbi:MAG: hypothetical protein ACJ8C9_02950 [Microvirga sp.]